MEEGMMRRGPPRLEDIPDLIHRIQLWLPVKEAARTSVLSKSWLHAWSTIPTLRFREAAWSVTRELKGELLKVVNNTLIRYLRDNIPIQSININIDIENAESASFAQKWIREMVTKSCLQELSLGFCVTTRATFTLPEEILSGINLSNISVFNSTMRCVRMPSHHVIKCVYLRELVLELVLINEDVLDNIFSTCSLLEKIHLSCCTGFKTIKVKNLHCLHEFGIHSQYKKHVRTVLEIHDVPNIGSFTFHANPLPFNLDSLRSVTQLSLGCMIVDDAIVHIMESKFPFLESLTLDLDYRRLESFNFTCASIKRISIKLRQDEPVNIKVYAPKLVFFHFRGTTMPSLLFPATINLDEMKLNLFLMIPRAIDESFFLKMREALKFSRKCDIEMQITNFNDIMPSDMINIDDLRRRVPFPAINVQRISFTTLKEYKGLGKRSPFFDALFSICHPKHVVAHEALQSKHNYFSQLMVREVVEKKTRKGYWVDYLKDVEIRRHNNEQWETLTKSWRSFLVGPAHLHRVEFKLNWR